MVCICLISKPKPEKKEKYLVYSFQRLHLATYAYMNFKIRKYLYMDTRNNVYYKLRIAIKQLIKIFTEQCQGANRADNTSPQGVAQMSLMPLLPVKNEITYFQVLQLRCKLTFLKRQVEDIGILDNRTSFSPMKCRSNSMCFCSFMLNWIVKNTYCNLVITLIFVPSKIVNSCINF